jgi:hypothetical protein
MEAAHNKMPARTVRIVKDTQSFNPPSLQLGQQALVGERLLITVADAPHSRGTPLDEWSARRKNLTTHNPHKRQTSMPGAGFKLTFPASERP